MKIQGKGWGVGRKRERKREREKEIERGEKGVKFAAGVNPA